MVRLTDCPDMTLDVYRGRKTTTQHNNNIRGTLSDYKFLRVNMINEPHHAKMNLTFLQTVNTQPHLTVIPCRIAILNK